MAKPDAPQVIVMIGTAGAVLAAGVGGTVLAVQQGGVATAAPRTWFIVAGWLFGLTVLYAVLYFLVHPAVEGLANHRRVKMAEVAQNRPPDPPAFPGGGIGTAGWVPEPLTIVSASYGADGHGYVDVADHLRARIVDGHLKMPVMNDDLGGDPAINVPKHLIVDYGTNTGIREIRTYLEGSEIELP
jgi:hypothetical protein